MDNVRKVAVQSVSDILGTDETTSFTILVAFLVGFVTVFLLVVLLARRSKRSKTVLITGISGAGKTALLSRLYTGTVVDTYTSMKENVESVHNFSLVDLPGADKIRKQAFQNQVKSSGGGGGIRGLIYLVDGSTFTKEAKDVAEYLYDILCDRAVGKRLPVLIACNKQDIPVAKSAEVIKNMLAKEFTILNTTKAASLDSTEGGDGGRNLLLGGNDKEFRWSSLVQKVQFCECAVKEGTIQPIEEWIQTL
jgi:signal recognition particle receptor subunit beta